MQSSYLYGAVAGFASGIFIASLHAVEQTTMLFVLLVAVGLWAVAGRRGSAPASHYLFVATFFLIALVAGAARFSVYDTGLALSQLSAAVGEKVALEGVVAREPEVRKTTTHLYIKADNTLLLAFINRYTDVAYGDRVNLTGVLAKPEAFETDLGRTFNYPGYLKSRGVMNTVRYAEVEVLESGEGNRVIGTLLGVKQLFLNQIEQSLPEPQAGLAEGLLLGVKRALGNELEETFRSTGIIHIVVLSGYNIMLVVTFVMYVLSLAVPFRGRLVLGLAAVAAFALMVGLSATVVRASIMAALALVAKSLGLTYSVVRALFLAGVVMLLINPYLLVFDTGFQLSFLATLGLIVLAPRLESYFSGVPSGIIGVRGFLVATLATQIFVLPILLYQIGEFSVVAVAVNVLVLPMVPVAMLATFLMVLLGLVSAALATPLVWLSYASLTYIIVVPSFFASLPFAAFAVPAFPFYLVVLAYGVLLFVLHWRHKELDPLGDWIIVDEESIANKNQKSVTNLSDEPPIFFK